MNLNQKEGIWEKWNRLSNDASYYNLDDRCNKHRKWMFDSGVFEIQSNYFSGLLIY